MVIVLTDYAKAQQALIEGILDALPCPTAMLNAEGDVVYQNALCDELPVVLEDCKLSDRPEVISVLLGEPVAPAVVTLEDPDGKKLTGTLSVYGIDTEAGLVGALFMFRDGPAMAADPLLSATAAQPTPASESAHTELSSGIPLFYDTDDQGDNQLALVPDVKGHNLHQMQRNFTRRRIEEMLALYGNTVEGKREAARALGIGLSTLYRLMSAVR